jgi:hypothetical protein
VDELELANDEASPDARADMEDSDGDDAPPARLGDAERDPLREEANDSDGDDVDGNADAAFVVAAADTEADVR